MILRRIKKEPELADKIKEMVVSSECRYEPDVPGSPSESRRKPSERFMRRPLLAKSKASTSERIRIAGLVEKLRGEPVADDTVNGPSNFNGYMPGLDEGPPG